MSISAWYRYAKIRYWNKDQIEGLGVSLYTISQSDNNPKVAMAIVETRYEHVVLDETRRPVIAGTTMKVTELVLGKIAYGWSPEELRFQYPYLTFGQIHSALAYYWDHQEEMDRDIEEHLKEVDRLRASAASTAHFDWAMYPRSRGGR